ncbi:MAG: outer membrane beta-barrel protein [Bacteroidetes bacterium]|nr:outer membrane beta-barrel protein [Bacteroidota bacterium]
MKKLFFFIIVAFLIIETSHAQMSYSSFELNINSPNETAVYKKYMEGKTYIGASGGISIPIGSDYSKNVNLGIGAGMQGKYFISDHFAFGASFNFYRSSFKDAYLQQIDTMFTYIAFQDSSLKVLSVSGASTLYPFSLNFEYYLSPMQKFKPYFGLGLGFYVINHNVEISINKEKPQFFRDEETLFAGSSLTSNFGFTPYAGFMLDFNELISANFEVKYNQIISKPVCSALTINIGIMFNLAYKY